MITKRIWMNSVTLWDPLSLKKLKSFGHNLNPLPGAICPSIVFSSDTHRLAAASYDGTVRVWKLK